MVSIKFSVAAATAALLHVASARKCTASVQDFVDGGIGGGAFTHYRIGVRFNGNEDYLDSQDTDSKDDLDIYDGKQTLTSDKLGGDVLIWADKADVTGQSRLEYALLPHPSLVSIREY